MGSRSGSELLPESSPSTPAAHGDHWVDGDDVWIRIDVVHGPFGRGCCQTTFSGTRRGNGTDGSTVTWGSGCGSLWLLGQEWSWLARSLLVYPLTQWLERPLVQTVPGGACQSWRLLEESPLPRCLPRRAVRTWKSGLRLLFQSFWCLGVACGVRRIGFFGTRALLGSTVDTFSTGGFGQISLIFYVAVNSNPEPFLLYSV